MARIGLSKPYVAAYSASGTTVTYASGASIGKFTKLELQLNSSENKFYADNGVAESDDQFGGGTVTISTDDLSPAAFKQVLGLAEENITGVSGVTTEGAKWQIFNDDQAIPFLGLGGVVKKKVGGAVKWVGIAFDRVQFRNPNETFETQGETVVWNTPELIADIFKSDNTKHSWRRVTTLLSSEAEAEAAVKAFLSIT